MVGCVLSQLNPQSSTFLAVEKAFSTAKNVELLGLYPQHNMSQKLAYSKKCGNLVRTRREWFLADC